MIRGLDYISVTAISRIDTGSLTLGSDDYDDDVVDEESSRAETEANIPQSKPGRLAFHGQREELCEVGMMPLTAPDYRTHGRMR